jgi:hypothetical protein
MFSNFVHRLGTFVIDSDAFCNIVCDTAASMEPFAGEFLSLGFQKTGEIQYILGINLVISIIIIKHICKVVILVPLVGNRLVRILVHIHAVG